tara:strand:+ start:1086 stop:1376 length:291 start_codon:yes stop_codon:yes gene_type:complete
MNIEIIGYIAAILGGTLKLPQIYKIITTKEVNALSLNSLFLEAACATCWTAFAIEKKLQTVLLGNALYGAQVGIIIGCYLKWRHSTTAELTAITDI